MRKLITLLVLLSVDAWNPMTVRHARPPVLLARERRRGACGDTEDAAGELRRVTDPAAQWPFRQNWRARQQGKRLWRTTEGMEEVHWT